MQYSTIDLTLDTETARERILARVSGITCRETDGSIVFRSSSGFHLAELTEVTLPNGETGTRLSYRTTILSPTAATARRKAKRIRDAVESQRYGK